MKSQKILIESVRKDIKGEIAYYHRGQDRNSFINLLNYIDRFNNVKGNLRQGKYYFVIRNTSANLENGFSFQPDAVAEFIVSRKKRNYLLFYCME